MRKFFEKYIALLLLLVLATSCFTGIESTKKISDKDVAKVVQERGNTEEVSTAYNSVNVSNFPDWNEGKRFFVADNNIKRVFSPSSAYDVDTINLAERMLTYIGYTEGNVLDNEPNVNIRFTDGVHEYLYPTKKTIEVIRREGIVIQVPFLIDEDIVNEYGRMLGGKSFYIRTPIWYDERGEMIAGKKFIKVTIQNVYPGDKVFPLRVSFKTEDDTVAYVFMSTKQSSIQNRLFGNLFSEMDIRLKYPAITDTNWNNIVNGNVAIDMTKDECRLSLGTPNNVQERPTNDGLQEYWFYSDGMYLVFFDGLLKQYRK